MYKYVDLLPNKTSFMKYPQSIHRKKSTLKMCEASAVGQELENVSRSNIAHNFDTLHT